MAAASAEQPRFKLGRGRPPLRVVLTAQDRAELERLVRGETTTVRDLRRASIILACAEGRSAEAVGEYVGVAVSTVRRWRSRFLHKGMQGLSDLPRPGHARIIPLARRMEVVAAACDPAPQAHGMSGWTLDRLREEVIRLDIVSDTISRSTIWRILDENDLRPWQVRGWLHSPDPLFREKVNEICGLYLHPPKGAVVVSIDEKTGMQAIERKYEGRIALPGRPGRREFEYIRHGTQSLIAGFNIRNGDVTWQCGNRRKARDLLRFMNALAEKHPGVEIHVIWDNLNIHTGERWERFNRRHGGRFHFHYTPLHASWVNQIESFFSIVQAKVLRHGSFRSTRELREAVVAFLAHWNSELAHPFHWTCRGYAEQTSDQQLRKAA